jgi:tetratricopeptide (TPR) repeat protein
MPHELVEKFLQSAEELIETKGAQERLFKILDQAEKLLPNDPFVLCRSAKVLFHFGVLNSSGRCFLLALDKLNMAKETDPNYFETSASWFQLWGNILIQVGKLLGDNSFIGKAIEKYQQGLKRNHQPELYWDCGEAWVLLGKKSGESTDFKQGLAYFHKAQQEGLCSPFFRLDFAHALIAYGKHCGEICYLEESLFILKNLIVETYIPKENPTVSHTLAWRQYSLAMKTRYQLTHSEDHFIEADTAYREAILTTRKNSDLWLDWADLYLYAGWIQRDFKLMEAGLDKLTSPKIKECNPIKTSLCLGKGLLYLGLYLENYKAIKDGQERIREAHSLDPKNPDLNFAMAFADFALGLYFADPAMIKKSAQAFERGLRRDTSQIEPLHALYQVYLTLGLKLYDRALVKKGIKAISRLSELRPYSPVYLNEWGVALLRLRHLEANGDKQQACIEEAIDKFRKANQLRENEETYYNWGCALDLLGDLTGDEEDYGQAIDLLTKVYEKRPSEHVRFQLALTLSHLGELIQSGELLSQACELFDFAVKSDPEDEKAWCELGFCYLNLSEILRDTFKEEEEGAMRNQAEKALTRAAELGSADACYHLACLYSLSGYNEASLHYLTKAKDGNSLPAREELERDEWLENVRKTEAFQLFFKDSE